MKKNMNNGNIELKPVKELLGMNFYIPDYQRGYRWEEQQVKDLLEDIKSFLEKTKNKPNSSEIYCIQPLVVQRQKEKSEEELLEEIKKSDTDSIKKVKEILNDKWNVVDGQQRLTTIFLVLKCLNKENLYSIEYQTRKESRSFLNDISSKSIEESQKYIDYFYFYKVYKIVEEWFNEKDDNFKSAFENTLLEKVNFIWYEISDRESPISVFTRLNIGKIPLTNAELIKALFLNRSYFDSSSTSVKELQLEIASQWDDIETTLQNDEFWLFIHDKSYDKPTRIDFILDYICEQDKDFNLFNITGDKRNTKKRIARIIGNDEYTTFRYFYEAFNYLKNHEKEDDWLRKLWEVIKRNYEIFNEWYTDYRLFHYVGYVLSTDIVKLDQLLKEYSQNNTTREEFVDWIKGEIKNHFNDSKNKEWFNEIDTYVFSDGKEDTQENAVKRKDKTVCRPLLLLHNIETIIQQNKKLVSESKYNLPNFNKFPFHLYKSESWQVEHIHPNAGERLKEQNDKKLYLILAKKTLQPNEQLYNDIDAFLEGKNNSISFEDLYREVNKYGSPISDENKNKLFNFTLLDETTNKEYQNAIFPIKRAFLVGKEQGKKKIYKLKAGNEIDEVEIDEIAFVPICTKNVFSKSYTELPSSLMSWTVNDANYYLKDIVDKLKDYFSPELIGRIKND